MNSVTWRGKTFGVPTNNETMALIWNAQLFARITSRARSAPSPARNSAVAMNHFLVLKFHAHDVPWWDDLVVGGARISSCEWGAAPASGRWAPAAARRRAPSRAKRRQCRSAVGRDNFRSRAIELLLQTSRRRNSMIARSTTVRRRL